MTRRKGQAGPAGGRITGAIDAAMRAGAHPVGGNETFSAAGETTLAGLSEITEDQARETGLAAASHALRRTRGQGRCAAAAVLLELLWVLGLKEDPQCQWEPRTASDKWTGKRRRAGDAA